MGDLRNQLLKAGLVDKKVQQQADAQTRKKKKRRKKKKKKARGEEEEARQAVYAERLSTEATENRARAEQQRAEQATHEQRQQIANLAGHWALRELKPGPRRWYFATATGKIKRFDLSLELAERLEKGTLAIVDRPGDSDEPYAIVPQAAARRIAAIDPTCIRCWNRRDGAPALPADDGDRSGASS